MAPLSEFFFLCLDQGVAFFNVHSTVPAPAMDSAVADPSRLCWTPGKSNFGLGAWEGEKHERTPWRPLFLAGSFGLRPQNRGGPAQDWPTLGEGPDPN